jgi:tetratricopeptide (TPR) repeat protein
VGDERLQNAAANEDIIACMNEGEYARVIEIAESVLARIGEFPTVMNNLGEACFHSGEVGRAIDVARRVAELEPENFHALANLTRYLFFSGHLEDARAVVERLRTVQSERKDVWIKKCEALATLGDDEGVLAVFAEAEAAGVVEARAPEFAVLFHLVAAANSRQGKQTQAERWWRTALKLQPGMSLVRENLADASKRASERSGAWYFSLEYWGVKKTIESLRQIFDVSADSDEALLESVREFANLHPEFIKLIPALLDRGDPAARKLTWMIAMKLDMPETIDALRTFCTSQWGPDWMRMETAQYLNEIGALPGPEVRMWSEGKCQTANMFTFEISSEPRESNHSEQVLDWIYDGLMAIRAGDGKHAERLFQKCIDSEGESPDLLNNLAISYRVQGRMREAEPLLRQIHQRWPDYFFGRISMASQAIIDGDLDRARDYLEPLCRRKKYHISEFAALANVQIQFALEQENLESARNWLDMWEEIDPDNPDLQEAGLRVALEAGRQFSGK